MAGVSAALSSPGVSLLLQSLGMLLGTFACGTVPLYLPLSKTKLRVLEVMGAGLLVGASMTVVLPEGVNALYQTSQTSLSASRQSWAWSALKKRAIDRDHDHTSNPETIMGTALLAGFLIMFLIDQIAAPGAHVSPTPQSHSAETDPRSRQSPAYLPSHRPETLRLTRASSLSVAKLQQDGSGEPYKQAVTVESSPEQLPVDHDTIESQHSPLLGEGRRTSPNTATNGRQMLDSSEQHDNTVIAQRRGLREAFSSIAGLVIHAAADGIAMGASAGSSDESLKLIVLFAIMIHKAPASFGLCTLLMGRRLHKRDIHKAILVFSMSTPVGAILTYMLLSLVLTSDSEDSISPLHIGTALTFSAGTFMFVAMHAVQELASATADIDESSTRGSANHRSPHHNASNAGGAPRQILGRAGRVAVFLLGTVLPKSLQSLTGHSH